MIEIEKLCSLMNTLHAACKTLRVSVSEQLEHSRNGSQNQGTRNEPEENPFVSAECASLLAAAVLML
jgi:hypothetical protein